jgi:hypothetical protein
LRDLIIRPNVNDKHDTEHIHFEDSDIIYYDEKLEWVDIINNVGMMKSLNEVQTKKLYDRVILTKNIKKIIKFKPVSRYMIYSYDIKLKKKNQNVYKENLSLRVPNKWDWYSDSLTFDMISNINNRVWNILKYPSENDDSYKFVVLLNMLNIHIEQADYE